MQVTARDKSHHKCVEEMISIEVGGDYAEK